MIPEPGSAKKGMASLGAHFVLGWAMVIATLYLVCFKVPLEEKTLGSSYLIFFFHFPSSIACLVLFVMAGFFGALQLLGGAPEADHRSAAAVEVGFLACTICLVTGMTWADFAWGKPWVWEDKRLLSVAIMWFCYTAYLVFRANIDNPEQRVRFSAVMSILFALNVPMVWFSIRIFKEVRHPMTVTLDGANMKLTQWFGALAFLVLYLAFWRLRARGMTQDARAARLDEALQDARL